MLSWSSARQDDARRRLEEENSGFRDRKGGGFRALGFLKSQGKAGPSNGAKK